MYPIISTLPLTSSLSFGIWGWRPAHQWNLSNTASNGAGFSAPRSPPASLWPHVTLSPTWVYDLRTLVISTYVQVTKFTYYLGGGGGVY